MLTRVAGPHDPDSSKRQVWQFREALDDSIEQTVEVPLMGEIQQEALRPIDGQVEILAIFGAVIRLHQGRIHDLCRLDNLAAIARGLLEREQGQRLSVIEIDSRAWRPPGMRCEEGFV